MDCGVERLQLMLAYFGTDSVPTGSLPTLCDHPLRRSQTGKLAYASDSDRDVTTNRQRTIRFVPPFFPSAYELMASRNVTISPRASSQFCCSVYPATSSPVLDPKAI